MSRRGIRGDRLARGTPGAAIEGWETFAGHTPHRPWIDQVKIRNPADRHLMARVPDVGIPGFDAASCLFHL